MARPMGERFQPQTLAAVLRTWNASWGERWPGNWCGGAYYWKRGCQSCVDQDEQDLGNKKRRLAAGDDE